MTKRGRPKGNKNKVTNEQVNTQRVRDMQQKPIVLCMRSEQFTQLIAGRTVTIQVRLYDDDNNEL